MSRFAWCLVLGVSLALSVDVGAQDNQGVHDDGQAAASKTGNATAEASGPQVSTVTLQSRDHEIYGRYLTDGVGRALYVFTRDQTGNSNCLGKCIETWPPLIQTGMLRTQGIDESLMGTTLRDGGIRQVTYAGRPLYYYVAEVRSNGATAHSIQGFGGTWHLISPDGVPIE